MSIGVERLLAEAREHLDRVSPRQAAAAMVNGAVLVDIRSDAQRARRCSAGRAVHRA